MIYRLESTDQMDRDLNEAILYYLQISPKIATQLAEEVEKAYRLLSNSPFFAIRYGEVRCLPLRRFPYMLHYTVEEEQQLVRLLGLLHTGLDATEHWKL